MSSLLRSSQTIIPLCFCPGCITPTNILCADLLFFKPTTLKFAIGRGRVVVVGELSGIVPNIVWTHKGRGVTCQAGPKCVCVVLYFPSCFLSLPLPSFVLRIVL